MVTRIVSATVLFPLGLEIPASGASSTPNSKLYQTLSSLALAVWTKTEGICEGVAGYFSHTYQTALHQVLDPVSLLNRARAVAARDPGAFAVGVELLFSNAPAAVMGTTETSPDYADLISSGATTRLQTLAITHNDSDAVESLGQITQEGKDKRVVLDAWKALCNILYSPTAGKEIKRRAIDVIAKLSLAKLILEIDISQSFEVRRTAEVMTTLVTKIDNREIVMKLIDSAYDGERDKTSLVFGLVAGMSQPFREAHDSYLREKSREGDGTMKMTIEPTGSK